LFSFFCSSNMFSMIVIMIDWYFLRSIWFHSFLLSSPYVERRNGKQGLSAYGFRRALSKTGGKRAH
jgi:hypothetical protein